MKSEDKELLLRDLSARLPYGVKVNVKGVVYDSRSCRLTGIHHGLNAYIEVHDGMQYHIESIKPYLLPLSSMTEEQKKEMSSFDPFRTDEVKTFGDWAVRLVDFYNKYHLDFRGLIPKGLANDATNLNIY